MQLVLNTEGLSLRVKDRVFYVSAGDEFRKISPEVIDSIAITSPCMLSSAAVMLAADVGIPIYFFDHIGDARSCLRSPYFESLATLRRQQVYFSDSVEGAKWVVEQFRLKTEQQTQLLTYLKNRKPGSAVRIEKVIDDLTAALREMPKVQGATHLEWNAAVMGWEGAQARKYWQCIGQMLPEPWKFKVRSRQPARDAFNAMLNYGYGMLYSLVEQAVFAAGLDPHLGILHVDQYDRPTLAYDLIEPFRPWIDRFVVQLLFKGKMSEDYFEPFKGGIYLSKNGKRLFIPAFNEWMLAKVRWEGRQQARRDHIYRSAGLLARQIREVSAGKF